MTRDEFIEDVFFGQAYAFRATIIGFNLPFDLARLAIAACFGARRYAERLAV